MTDNRHERGKAALAVNLPVLNDDEVELAASLVGAGQGHLFESWPGPGIRDDDKRRFLRQAAALDAAYDGGLKAYCLRAKEHLLRSVHGESGSLP